VPLRLRGRNYNSMAKFKELSEQEEHLRLDLLVDDLVIVELKAVELVNPVWEAQIISHLKLTKLNLGYLINFNVALIKNGIRRFKN